MTATNYDVVIVGAGPVGITTACTLKALNSNLRISVLDKRTTPKRTHGLLVQADAIAAISGVLKSAPETEDVASLRQIYSSWNGHFVRTNDIETTLKSLSERMGIQVLRDQAYEISQGDLKVIFAKDPAPTFSQKQRNLQSIFQNVPVVIAADGSHSVMRQELEIPLVEEENLQYLAELKYQTEAKTEPRGYKEATFYASKVGHVAAETMNRSSQEDKKPATFLLFINEAAYKSLREADKEGKIKGVYGNPWTLSELQQKTDSHVQDVYKSLERYIQSLQARGGSCLEGKISTLELNVYRMRESVKSYEEKHILFVGDANSGLVLQRGFNKGLKEAALCAHTVSEFFKNPLSMQELASKYQIQTQAIFEAEKSAIHRKNTGINLAQSVVRSTASSMEKVQSSSESSSRFFSWLGNWSKSSDADQ